MRKNSSRLVDGSASSGVVIGVLALQGDYEKHLQALRKAGAKARLVRTPAEIAQVDGLVIPGGESTTVGLLMERTGTGEAIRKRAADGMPVYGTCTGLILMAKEIEDSRQYRLGLMDIAVRRNAYGRQIDSFEAEIEVPELGEPPIRAVFIRAPQVTGRNGTVSVLGELDGVPVLLRQGNLLASSFHPELTEDARIHKYFVRLVSEARS